MLASTCAVLIFLRRASAPQKNYGPPRGPLSLVFTPKPRQISAEEIVERTIYALVNEGARILEEGYALRAVDIDVIYINGYGFPAYRGGPMWYADTVGLKKVYERIREFEKDHGALWTPAPLLKQLAEEGKTFADFYKKIAATA